MERRIMDEEAIEQRIGDVWFTNGYGHRFPNRNAHVMLAIENGIITYGFNRYSGEKIIEHSSERLCITLWRNDNGEYRVTFDEYGGGRSRQIFQEPIDAREICLYRECKDGYKVMMLQCCAGIAFISYPQNANVYEDDWRKCEKCGLEYRLCANPISFMGHTGFAWNSGVPACGHCRQPTEY